MCVTQTWGQILSICILLYLKYLFKVFVVFVLVFKYRKSILYLYIKYTVDQVYLYLAMYRVFVLGRHGSASLRGMASKQNGGYNASISVQTPIFNSTRLKTVRSTRWCCPNSTMAPRLLENVVKVTNLEVVKIMFRHLPFLLLLQPA